MVSCVYFHSVPRIAELISNGSSLKKKKKLVIKLPYNLAIPHLGIYPEEIRTEKDTCTPMFIEPLFAIERT